MTKKDFKEFADLMVDINISFPFSGEIVNKMQEKIGKILRKNLTFDCLKWDRYIVNQVSKKMIEDKLKSKLCNKCLGKGYFEQSHDGMGRTLTCDKCLGTGHKQEK